MAWTQVETVTLASKSLGDGLLLLPNGMLYANTTQGPACLIRWQNPATDLATFDTVTYTNDGTMNAGIGFCYDASTDRIYQCFTGYDTGTRWNVKVEVINPSTLTHSTLITDDFGDSSLVFSPGTPNLTSDGTYLYLLTHSSASLGPEAEVRKYLLSDGSSVAQRTITGKNRGHPIAYDAATATLYGGGTGSTNHGYAFSMPVSLASHTTVDLAASACIVCDDIVLRGSYFWLQDESTARVWRIDKAALTFDTISITATGVCDGLWNDTDQILLGIRDTGTSGSEVQSIDPTGLTAAHLFSTVSNVAKINEIIRSGNTIYVATAEASSKVARFADVAPAMPFARRVTYF